MKGAVDAPVACPAGTFNNITNAKNISECNPCIPGHYCEGSGLVEASGECDAGYFCKQGSKHAKPATKTADYGPCPVGHYCPKGTVEPKKCLPGTYNSAEGQDVCQPCLGGYFCLEGAQNSTECPMGHYCPNG